jgi:predicted metalloendopeptidase
MDFIDFIDKYNNNNNNNKNVFKNSQNNIYKQLSLLIKNQEYKNNPFVECLFSKKRKWNPNIIPIDFINKIINMKNHHDIIDSIFMLHSLGIKFLFDFYCDASLAWDHTQEINIVYLKSHYSQLEGILNNDSKTILYDFTIQLMENVQDKSESMIQMLEKKSIEQIFDEVENDLFQKEDESEIVMISKSFNLVHLQKNEILKNNRLQRSHKYNLIWIKEYFDNLIKHGIQVEWVSLHKHSFFHKIGILIKNLSIDVWKIYLIVNLLMYILARTSDFENFFHKCTTLKNLCKIEESLEAWWIEGTNLFVDTYKKELKVKKDLIRKICNDYIESIKKLVNISQWNNKSRFSILQKLENIYINIGWTEKKNYLPIIIKPQKELKYFDEWIMEGYSQQFFNHLNMYGKKPIPNVWNYPHPLIVNAFYSQERNTIFIGIPFLYQPFLHEYITTNGKNTFESCLNKSINEKNFLKNSIGIGRIITHEIMHAFDPGSICVSFNGLIDNVLYFDDKKHYQNIITHMNSIYTDYIMKNYKIKDRSIALKLSKKTQTENFSDVMALRIIWFTYKDYKNRYFKNSDQYDHELFIQYFIENQIEDDHYSIEYMNEKRVHSLANVRINVPLNLIFRGYQENITFL